MKKVLRLLNLDNSPTAEEKLEKLTKEIKQERLLDTVLEIRRNGYVPDYNKPLRHADYVLTHNDEIVSGKVTTSCPRPQEFKNMEEWYTTMRNDFQKELEEKKKKELRQQLWQLTIDVHFTPSIMKNMMKVD